MSLTYGFCLDGRAHSSAEFSGVIQALAGDGITAYGARFPLSINGFTVTLGTGRILAAGRWLLSDEPLTLTVSPPDNADDRTDAIAATVDEETRAVSLAILPDVDAAAIRADSSSLRAGGTYSIVLYLIAVRRGATSLALSDVTDLRDDAALCGRIVPYGDFAGDALRVYEFLQSGVDREVARVLSLGQAVIDRGTAEIERLDAAIAAAGGAPQVGELTVARKEPVPSGEWLLCDGGPVPAEYPALAALLAGGTLPNLSRSDSRYGTWIYAGEREEVG